GFVYPIWAMPTAYSTFAQILPFTHFMNAFIKFYFMGTDINSAYPEIRNLLLFIIISLLIIIPVLFYQIRKLRKNQTESVLLK
ncbi:MAG TPA: ABC transporter permease, partial [Ignavibacteria bacterium]|nr:ABC transporter permease [Ignavibacteria bacterium]